jgi:hypothetical protein
MPQAQREAHHQKHMLLLLLLLLLTLMTLQCRRIRCTQLPTQVAATATTLLTAAALQ